MTELHHDEAGVLRAELDRVLLYCQGAAPRSEQHPALLAVLALRAERDSLRQEVARLATALLREQP